LSSLPADPVAANDLISFLKVLPDCRMRRDIRFPQWWMLLVEILAILSGRNRLAIGELLSWRQAVALVAFAAIMLSHHRLFGVSPFPGGWVPF
jgi:uncharacterized membrane protein